MAVTIEQVLARCNRLASATRTATSVADVSSIVGWNPEVAIVQISSENESSILGFFRDKLPRVPIVAILDSTDPQRAKSVLENGAHSLIGWGHFDEVSLEFGVIQAFIKRDLEDVNRTLKVVNSILRHDVMNNLTVIGGGLEVYKMKKDEKFLNSSINAVSRSVDLIKKMKEVEMVVSPRQLKPTNLRPVVEAVLSKYHDKGIRFEVVGDATAIADEALASVFDNIVNNAALHSNSPVLRISISHPSEDRSEVRIADEGVGIPMDIRPKIWQEGYKYGSVGQSGLGLYIVKKIMERYEGNVAVEDNQPKGVAFVLTFHSPR
ncbi:MAG TPA: HAMP domain-containing sensor histidine kinase [Methanomassiliicoccales archaeon]|nr:HAMP domain-containing sensor histidine kinase [Methanomassiliicoccales archaeon]